jgi:hypothetical protein
MREPAVVGWPRVTKMSLWAIGTPSSGPLAPAARRRSASAACASAPFAVDRQRGAEPLVAGEAVEQVRRDLDARQLARGQRAAERRDAELVRVAHSITFGTR